MKNDKYMDSLAGYTGSIFQDFKSYLRREVDSVEDDIGLDLDEYISNFINYELPPGIYTSKTLSEVLLRNLQSEYEGVNNTVHIEFNDISMKTKLFVRPSILAGRFGEKSFLSTIFGFSLHCDFKYYNGYICQSFINLSTIDKLQLKCIVFDGSISNGFQKPTIFSFVLDKLAGY